jgi:hypothetical protein
MARPPATVVVHAREGARHVEDVVLNSVVRRFHRVQIQPRLVFMLSWLIREPGFRQSLSGRRRDLRRQPHRAPATLAVHRPR